jgi:hypothetical protein
MDLKYFTKYLQQVTNHLLTKQSTMTATAPMLVILLCLLVCPAVRSESCRETMKANGMDMTHFANAAAHGIHSLYLEEIRFFLNREKLLQIEQFLHFHHIYCSKADGVPLTIRKSG